MSLKPYQTAEVIDLLCVGNVPGWGDDVYLRLSSASRRGREKVPPIKELYGGFPSLTADVAKEVVGELERDGTIEIYESGQESSTGVRHKRIRLVFRGRATPEVSEWDEENNPSQIEGIW
ncbi:MAG: hypothetical protein ISS93_03600 [Candidatus Aenigmarchaeota archaeon]|nr:hypothetical protein [Candidatus Aenigmarchaeota archaeon]